ncbi:MAG: yjeF-like protein hydroxyethylthiazole kinaserelated protein [Paenibacillaceae bacterium]|jgi:NAD(P)H-hydrate epimerase|nr:yjeF-like protein hydroxyethylthiazole kinaserelated protein [Paenibacillaceae bacterium]
MFVVTAEEMRRLDRLAIEGLGLPALVLMENAGRAIAEEVLRVIRAKRGEDRRQWKGERWLVLAGKGNNGGDGLVAARHLLEAGVAVTAALVTAADRLTGEARQQAELAQRFGVPCLDASEGGELLPWQQFSGVIDALLGTGAAGAPREPYASLIRAANASGLPIVAADLASGLDADSGAAHDPCIRAERTVALAFLKRGHVTYPGALLSGQVTVAPIGIPEQLAVREKIACRFVNAATVADVLGLDPLLPRQPDTHKGTYGHVMAAAGSPAMPGAALLCVQAALRTGSGLVSWAHPESMTALAAGRIQEAMLAPLAENHAETGGLVRKDKDAPCPSVGTPASAPAQRGGWAATDPAVLAARAAKCSALVIGPGLGRWRGDTDWLRALWSMAPCPLVVDADALNMLADAADFHAWPRHPQYPAIITPHPGEMARLAKTSTPEVQRDRIGMARRFAAEHGVIVVLKGARTVTALPEGDVFINGSGNPGMATGGSGDVLAGIIASLLGQGLPGGQAAALGVYLHGAAGDRAAARRPAGEASLLAGDIIEQL